MILKMVVPGPRTHECTPPPRYLYGVGTVWACDTCSTQLRLEQTDLIVGDLGYGWMRLAPKDYLPIPPGFPMPHTDPAWGGLSGEKEKVRS